MIMSNISVKDFISVNSVNDFIKSTNHKKNIHIIVSGYKLGKRGVPYAVNGRNMLTGENVKVRLATAEEYARFYTSPNENINVRLEKAENAIKYRPHFMELAYFRGDRGAPKNGVLTFSDIRVDDDGTLIGRWPNVVISDPSREVAVVCDYQVFTHLKKPFILAMFSREAVSSEDITREKLDHMFSGRLLDTQSPMQTNVTTVVDFGDETATFTFFPNQIKEAKLVGIINVDVVTTYRPPQSLEEAIVNTTIKEQTSLTAATVIAAKAGIPFDAVKYDAAKINEGTIEHHRKLYDSVKNGTTRAVFIPGATLLTTKSASQAILGLKKDRDGNMKNITTNESRLKGAGYVSGVLGIQHTAVGCREPIPPMVRSLYTDNAIPDLNSVNFIRRNTQDLGQEIFKKIYGDAPSSRMNGNTPPQHDADDDKPSPF